MTRTESSVHQPVISHPAHPEHNLRLMVAGEFTCNACKQLGLEQSYRCEACDYDMHILCATCKTSFEHPLLKCKLDFVHKPPDGCYWCNACGDRVLGFMYFNRKENVDLHPRCAFLPKGVISEGVELKLDVSRHSDAVCHRCQKPGAPRNKYWSYRARVDGTLMYVHVACTTDFPGTEEKKKLIDAAGNSTWYGKVWKFCKLVAKLGFYVMTFDSTRADAMCDDVFDLFHGY